LKVPAGEELVFETIAGLARWASSHALATAEQPFLFANSSSLPADLSPVLC